MDLEKAYDRVHRKALWDVLRVGGRLQEGIKAFYKNTSAYLLVQGEPIEFCYRGGSMTGTCNVTMV